MRGAKLPLAFSCLGSGQAPCQVPPRSNRNPSRFTDSEKRSFSACNTYLDGYCRGMTETQRISQRARSLPLPSDLRCDGTYPGTRLVCFTDHNPASPAFGASFDVPASEL